MTKKDAQVVDIIVRFDERNDNVTVAILGGSLDFATIYNVLDRARMSVQDQERAAIIQQFTKQEAQDV